MDKKAVEEAIDDILSSNEGVMLSDFVISKVKNSSGVHKEIAGEFDFVSNTVFFVSLNNKSASDKVTDMIALVKSRFSEETILVLHGNEKKV